MAEMNARERFNLRTHVGNPRGTERDAIKAQRWREPDYKSGETSKPTQEDKYLSATCVVEDEAAPSQQWHTRGPLTYGLWAED